MTIKENLLTINEFSRPGHKLREVKAVILHWVANPNTSAEFNRRFFENRKAGKDGYGSAHFIIDVSGEVIQALKKNEVAYHVGSSNIDPASKKIYTDWAREKFGPYISPKSSPNYCTIGIELCHTDWLGTFSDATYKSAVDLVSELLLEFNLTSNEIGTHNMVVGWKDCPRLWVKNPALFDKFKEDVGNKMKGENK